jgi:hypothetical protein
MQTRTGIILGLASGMALLLIILAVFSINTTIAPGNHQTVANEFSIEDTSLNASLTLTCVKSGNVQWSVPLSGASFTNNKNYPQSTWIWQRSGDTDWTMTVWGPADDGHSYFIEFGRLGADSYTISWAGIPKIWVDAVNATPAVGYYQIVVGTS